MEHNEEKLSAFIDAVNADADEKVEAILNEARTERSAILDAANAGSVRAAQRYIDDNARKTGNRYVREVSRAELESKKSILRERERLTQLLFDEISEKLTGFRASPEYRDFLVKTAKSCDINDGSVIYLSPADMKHKDSIASGIGCKPSFEEDANIKAGGLSVYDTSSGTITDKTLDLALREQRSIFTAKNLLGTD